MIGIAFTFPAGRYHATPWDQHVNEGAVEWPPSPLRLLRAFLAASYKLDGELPRDDVRRVLAPLLTSPEYSVPPVGEGHSRHYMPAPVTTTKVIDAFVAPGTGALLAIWPSAELPPGDLQILDRILAQLTYLGRTESWVDAQRLDHVPDSANCWPCAPEQSNLALPAVESEPEYAQWRSGFEAGQAGLSKKERRDPPADWWDVLHVDIGRLRREGWTQPPGTRRVPYRLDVRMAARHARPRRSVQRPNLVRLELSAKVLPRLEEVLAVGHVFRRALLKKSDGHETFLGRHEGEIRRGNAHAYILPTDEDDDGRIDHVSIYAREGFDDAAIAAVDALREVWGHGAYPLLPFRTAAIAEAAFDDYGGVRAQSAKGRIALLGPAREWVSHTPFVPPRHAKVRGGRQLDSAPDQVQRLLVAFGLAAPVSIEELDETPTSQRTAWNRFRRRRFDGGGSGAGQAGHGFRITFAKPVTGPIAIGYGAHLGLGQFVAIQ